MSAPLLQGRTAVITGAGDIGGAIARRLLANGAAVEVWDASQTALDRLPAGISKRLVDVTSVEEVEAAAVEVARSLPPVDTLVNTAAVAVFAPVATMTVADWRRTLEVNLTGVFIPCQAFVSRFIAAGRGASIVNISSIGGLRGEPEFAGYCASKFGVIGFTQSLAREVGEHGIRVNAVCPGAVESRMNTETMARDARRTGSSVQDIEERIIAKTALRRLVQPDDVADAVVFLASDLSSCITAESISVTGGVF
jgi:meso-butanediol dehydrogenase / (S,S)-butanediol dehydrogenase / diacetyl reductase